MYVDSHLYQFLMYELKCCVRSFSKSVLRVGRPRGLNISNGCMWSMLQLQKVYVLGHTAIQRASVVCVRNKASKTKWKLFSYVNLLVGDIGWVFCKQSHRHLLRKRHICLGFLAVIFDSLYQ